MRYLTIVGLALLLAAGAGAEDLSVRGPATTVAGDLNGDGKLDLVLVDRDGQVTLAYQAADGAEGWPQFARPVPLLAGGRSLTLRVPADPQLVDLDQDGLVDLLFADAQGAVMLCRNTGTPQRPRFAPAAPVAVVATTGLEVAPPAVRAAYPSPAPPSSLADVIIPPVVPLVNAGPPPLAPLVSSGPPAVRSGISAPAATNTGIVVPPPPAAAGAANPVALPPPVITRPTLAPPPSAGATIAVIDFNNDARDAGLDWLRQGAPDVLAMAVPASTHYAVLPRARFQETELNLANIDEVFRGVNYVVKGNYWLEGDDLVFDVAIVDMEIVDIVRSFSLRGSRGNISPLMEQLEQQVRDYFAAGFPPAR